MSTDFLLELLSEEIPARMQDKAREDLARLFTAELAKSGISAGKIITFATPRRLALIANDLPLETEAVTEETKGPKVGAPPQALEGFLRKTGLTQDQLVERDGVYFAIVEKPGRKTADVLAEAIPAIIRAFPWPKSQRWGAASASTESLRWVRPLQGIVALLGEDVVPCAIDGISSGRETSGHRFMGRSTNPVRPEPVEGLSSSDSKQQGSASTSSARTVLVGNVSTYLEELRACHVIVDQEERRAIIRAGAEKAAADAGLVLVPDEGLVNENAGLTEWPVPLLGRFDPAFLEVPPEVIQLTARVNQKYFVCQTQAGKLANAFVCTANIVAKDGGAFIIAGNEKVLAARLSDAKFFWEQDLKVPLEEQAKKLSQITFHEKLGTVADKVERVAKLARWLVETGVVKSSPSMLGEGDHAKHGGGAAGVSGGLATAAPPSAADAAATPPSKLGGDLADLAERAARLCKADLVTGMVGEFPELQGVMGGYYARAQGEPDAVADAIRDHYKPVGQGDDVPTAPVTVAVSLADKLDTLYCFFVRDMKPTGSKDPFALRRSALSAIEIVTSLGIRLKLTELIGAQAMIRSIQLFDAAYDRDPKLSDFFGKSLDAVKPAKFIDEFVAKIREFEKQEDVKLKPDFDQKAANWLFEGALMIHLRKKHCQEILDFFADRLKVQQREAGVRHDLIDAVFALGGEDDLVRLLARVKALQGFITTPDGANLLAAYKRAANILKAGDAASAISGTVLGTNGAVTKARGETVPEIALFPEGQREKEEQMLLTALNAAEPQAAAAVEVENFEGAMAALASLRAPIDAFFDGVMVNDPDPQKRAFRLGLLERFRNAVHAVADFSKIEG